MYVYLKSLQQPTYLENLFIPIDQNGYFMFSNNSDVSLNKARPNFIFIFGDVACDKQNAVREYFSMGRHMNLHYCCYVTASISVRRTRT